MTLLKTIARCGLNTLLSVVDRKRAINTCRGISAFGTLPPRVDPPSLFSRTGGFGDETRWKGCITITMNEHAIDKTIRATDYYILWDLSSMA